MALNPLENLDLFTNRPGDGEALADISQRCTRQRIPVSMRQQTPAASCRTLRSEDAMTPMTEQFAFPFDTAASNASAESIGGTPIGSSQTVYVPPSSTPPSANTKRRWPSTSRLDDLEPPTRADRPASVQGCVAWLSEQLGGADPEFKAIRGAIATIAAVIHRTEDRRRAVTKHLPADPVQLRPLLAAALPAALRVSASRWGNVKSLLKSLLIATGWVAASARGRLPLSGTWSCTFSLVSSNQLRLPIRPFLRFCEHRGILPAQVTAGDLLAYEHWLINETLDLKPRSTVAQVQAAWRRLGRACLKWPQQDITTPSRVLRKTLSFADFPPSFEADVLAFMASLGDPNPLDPDAGRPMAETSVQHARRNILRAATCLVRSGSSVPAESITSIATLVVPAAFNAVLMILYEEGKPSLAAAGETAQWTKVAESIASTLVTAARRWVRIPPEVLRQLSRTRSMVVPRRGGLTNRVQDRLAEFATDEDRRELYELPWRAFDEADRFMREKDFRRGPKLHETALALALLLHHPMRIGNMMSLVLERHFLRDRRGRPTQVAIPATEVKNKVSIRFELPPDLAARFERHLTAFRPHIHGHAGTTALFPGARGGPRRPAAMGEHLRCLVERQIGKRFNAHLVRHLAVDIVTEETGGDLRPAQQLLGHRDRRTTEGTYGSRATLVANRRYQQILREQANRAAGAATRKPAARKPRNRRK